MSGAPFVVAFARGLGLRLPRGAAGGASHGSGRVSPSALCAHRVAIMPPPVPRAACHRARPRPDPAFRSHVAVRFEMSHGPARGSHAVGRARASPGTERAVARARRRPGSGGRGGGGAGRRRFRIAVSAPMTIYLTILAGYLTILTIHLITCMRTCQVLLPQLLAVVTSRNAWSSFGYKSQLTILPFDSNSDDIHPITPLDRDSARQLLDPNCSTHDRCWGVCRSPR